MSLRENNQTVQDYIRALEDRIRALELGNRINARSWLMQENSEGDFVFRHMDGRTITLGTSGTDIVLSGGAGGSLILGESAVTAYRGDRGKVAYDHSQIVIGNPHGTTKADVGLGLVPNVNLATAVASNSAKVTNATHTGDATGSGALSVVGLRGVGLDSSVSSPVDGDTLVYRSAGSDWVLEAKPTGGSGMTVVADQTARDALSATAGLQCFQTDNQMLQVYDGAVWQNISRLLKRTVLTSTSSSISATGIPLRENFQIKASILASGGTIFPAMRFNNDTGANYSGQQCFSGTYSGQFTSNTSMTVHIGSGALGWPVTFTSNFFNPNGKFKTMDVASQDIFGSDATTSLNFTNKVGKWSSGTQVTRVDVINAAGTGTFAIGSYVEIWG